MVLAEDLRQAVIQQAIQGKLTERSLTDTNIQNTLLEISNKRNCLDIDKKLLVSKEIDLDEVPFELPKTWAWIRLGSICEVITKGSSPKWQGINYTENGLLFITSENVGIEKLLLTERKYVEEKFDKISPRSSLKYGDLLTNIVGASIGRTALYDLNERANINQAVCVIRLVNIEFAPYVMKYMNSNTAYKIMMEDKVETARPNISLTNISDFLIPFPPVEEQQRIVDKINEIMFKIDEYEKIEKELEVLKKQFPINMKDALLQTAMQGKLTEQLESDSSVDDLLGVIRKEKTQLLQDKKIYKDKKLIENVKDKFEIDMPENWRNVHLQEICTQITDGEHKTPSRVSEYQGYYLLSARNILNGKLVLDDVDYVSKEEYEVISKRCNPHRNDILISCSGSVGRCCLISDDNHYVMVRSAAMIHCLHMNNKYIMYAIQSPYIQAQIDELKKQSVQANLFQSAIASLLVPIPSLEEQQRIVERLETLLPLCEDLKMVLRDKKGNP